MNQSTLAARYAARVAGQHMREAIRRAKSRWAPYAGPCFVLAADYAGEAAQLYAQAGDIQRAMQCDGARRLAQLAPSIYADELKKIWPAELSTVSSGFDKHGHYWEKGPADT